MPVKRNAFVPFVMGRKPWAERLAARCPVPGCVVIDVLDPQSIAFFRLVNAANARAFDGLAMPAWVQLDCASLPAGMIGFAARSRADVDRSIVDDITARADVGSNYDGLVPVSEYTCVSSVEPGHVVGFSLYSLVPGLGVRTKAMALAMHGARRQTGIAQVDNRALRTHVALGPLEIVQAPVGAHDRPETTICYTLHVPTREQLGKICAGVDLPKRVIGSERVAISKTAAREIGALIAQKGAHAIVDVTETEIGLRALASF